MPDPARKPSRCELPPGLCPAAPKPPQSPASVTAAEAKLPAFRLLNSPELTASVPEPPLKTSELLRVMSDSRGMVDIPQALAQLSVDGINRGFAPPHTAGQVLDALRNLTNHIGLLLQEKYPELAGMLPQDISKLPLEKKMEIVRTINSVFYTALKPLPETAPGDTRTFGETLLFEHGGYCEDLTAVYIGCIELLRQGGIDLPLYPVMGPGHELVGWDDRGAAAVAAKPQQPAFYVELNTPREEGDDRPYGEVFVSPKDYEARLQWDPARSRGYFVSLPRSAVIAGELYNRVAAFNQREEPDLVEGLAEISCALRITKSAQLYNILAAVQEGRGDYNGALRALQAAERYDGSKRSFPMNRARIHRILAEKSERPAEAEFHYREAVQACRQALTLPGGEKQEFLLQFTVPLAKPEIQLYMAELQLKQYQTTGKTEAAGGALCTANELITDAVPCSDLIKISALKLSADIREAQYDRSEPQDLNLLERAIANLQQAVDAEAGSQEQDDFSGSNLLRLGELKLRLYAESRTAGEALREDALNDMRLGFELCKMSYQRGNYELPFAHALIAGGHYREAHAFLGEMLTQGHRSLEVSLSARVLRARCALESGAEAEGRAELAEFCRAVRPYISKPTPEAVISTLRKNEFLASVGLELGELIKSARARTLLSEALTRDKP